MHITIVDDDKNIAHLIQAYLEKANYQTSIFYDGVSFMTYFDSLNTDLIILDVMLPGIDGFKIKEQIHTQVPLIYLTAKSDVENRIHGLKLGADDYIVKPFDGQELVARVEAVLRRVHPKQHILKIPYLTLDIDAREVTYFDESYHLPNKEFELLYFLLKNKGQVFTRDQLIEAIWGYDSDCDFRTVDVHIKRLREKFSKDQPWTIKTVWGVGYKLEV